jgi:hypothetical protein
MTLEARMADVEREISNLRSQISDLSEQQSKHTPSPAATARLSHREAAALLNISEKTLARRVKARIYHCIRTGHERRYDAEQLKRDETDYQNCGRPHRRAA